MLNALDFLSPAAHHPMIGTLAHHSLHVILDNVQLPLSISKDVHSSALVGVLELPKPATIEVDSSLSGHVTSALPASSKLTTKGFPELVAPAKWDM